MRVWVQTYYIANRFGSMIERERTYGSSLQLHEVRQRADRFIINLQQKGAPVYPQYDLVQEMRA